jgi:tetratricopeptide (TPR) repeat protein
VPVTIGLLRHFKPNNTPLWVDIELDYFSPLYKNPVSSSYLGLLSGFVNAYQKLAIEPQLLTITYGNADGQLPLKNRYLGPWLKTMLVKPEILSSTPPASWLAKEEALYHDFFVQTDDAITILGNVLEQVPNNPDIHYTLGIMLIKLGQMKQAQRSLTRASSLDQAFSLGILDYLMLASATQDPEHVDSLLNSAVRSGYASPLMLRAAALRAKESSDHEQTIRLLRQLIEAGDDSPAVYAMLGQSYSKTGRDKEALESFQKAMALLKQPPHTDQLPGAWLSLAEHQEITGDFQAAELTYQEYLALFPYEPQERQELVKKRLDKLSAQDGK